MASFAEGTFGVGGDVICISGLEIEKSVYLYLDARLVEPQQADEQILK